MLPGLSNELYGYELRHAKQLIKSLFGFFICFICCNLWIFVYIPALLYRWNIKASAWIWWSAALVLKKSTWLPEAQGQDLRESTGLFSSQTLRWLYVAIATLCLAWLATPLLSQNWLVELHKQYGFFKLLPTPPALGIRYGLLSLQSILLLLLFWQSQTVRATHDKALTGAKDYRDYTEDEKAMFAKRAEPVHTMLRWNLACFVLLVCSCSAVFAVQWKPELANALLWQWIQPWL